MRSAARQLCWATLIMSLAACTEPDPADEARDAVDSDGPAERAGEALDRGAEATGEAAREGWEATKEGAERAWEGAKDAVDDPDQDGASDPP